MPTTPKEAGFTLLEVMIAAVILSISLFAVISMQTTTARANENSMDLRTATVLARSELATLQCDAMEWDGTTITISDPRFGPAFSTAMNSLSTAAERIGDPEAGWVVTRTGSDSNNRINALGLRRNPDNTFSSRRAKFCVESRIIDETESLAAPLTILSAQIRVYWSANEVGESLLSDCSALIGNRDSINLRRIELQGPLPWYR